MRNEDWISLLTARFPGKMGRKEYAINECPYCGNVGADRGNFEVNIEKLVFSCWACGVGGTVRRLFIEHGLPLDGIPERHYGLTLEIEAEREPVQLPDGCRPVLDRDALLWHWAARYLLFNRRIKPDEIVEYGLQFTLEHTIIEKRKRYAGRVIWPLYEDEELVYFVARTFMDGIGRPYDYPDFRRSHICSVYLGRGRERTTLVLVEGVFQVPNIHRLGYSVMPLLGTQLTRTQVNKLVMRRFQRVIVLLDEDALEKSVHLANRIKYEGLNAMWAQTGGPDSDELEDDELQRVLAEAKPPSVQSLVAMRLTRRRRRQRAYEGAVHR